MFNEGCNARSDGIRCGSISAVSIANVRPVYKLLFVTCF